MSYLKWHSATGDRQIGIYFGLPIAILYPPGDPRAMWKAEAVMPGCQAFVGYGEGEAEAKDLAEKFVADWIGFPRFQHLQNVECTGKVEITT